MMKKGIVVACFLLIIACCVVSLVIDIRLLYHTGIYVDKAGISPTIMLGGQQNVLLEWLRILLSPVIIGLSCVGIWRTLW